MLKYLIIIFLLIFNTDVYSTNTPLIKHYLTGDTILQSNWRNDTFAKYNSGDTFTFGIIDETGTITMNNESIYFARYLNVSGYFVYVDGKVYKYIWDNANITIREERLFSSDGCSYINYGIKK